MQRIRVITLPRTPNIRLPVTVRKVVRKNLPVSEAGALALTPGGSAPPPTAQGASWVGDKGTHHDGAEDTRILSGIEGKPIFEQAKREKYSTIASEVSRNIRREPASFEGFPTLW